MYEKEGIERDRRVERNQHCKQAELVCKCTMKNNKKPILGGPYPIVLCAAPVTVPSSPYLYLQFP
jgi:hypothetical protein